MIFGDQVTTYGTQLRVLWLQKWIKSKNKKQDFNWVWLECPTINRKISPKIKNKTTVNLAKR